MPMSEAQPMSSLEEIASSLHDRAEELWGHRRTLEIQSVIQQTAEHIWRISQNMPASEDEPGFYF